MTGRPLTEQEVLHLLEAMNLDYVKATMLRLQQRLAEAEQANSQMFVDAETKRLEWEAALLEARDQRDVARCALERIAAHPGVMHSCWCINEARDALEEMGREDT